jgi:hypothetical protein
VIEGQGRKEENTIKKEMAKNNKGKKKKCAGDDLKREEGKS